MNLLKIKKIILCLFYAIRFFLFKKTFFATINITKKCNLNCKYCFNSKNKNKDIEFPIDKFKELYDKGIRVLIISGGEPSLCLDALNIARKYFPIIQVISNGTIKIPLTFSHTLFISIDGNKEYHDKFRGREIFDTIIKNYKADKRVFINMTLSIENYMQLEEVLQISAQNKWRGVMCNLVAPTTEEGDIPVLTKEERKIIINEILRVREKYPSKVLINNSKIKWLLTGDHKDSCFFRKNCLHFDADWSQIVCYTARADCKNCGCFSGGYENFFDVVGDLYILLKTL